MMHRIPSIAIGPSIAEQSPGVAEVHRLVGHAVRLRVRVRDGRRQQEAVPAARIAAPSTTAVTTRYGATAIARPAGDRPGGPGRHAAHAPHAVEPLEDRAPVDALDAEAVRVHRRVHRRVEHAVHDVRGEQRRPRPASPIEASATGRADARHDGDAARSRTGR